MKLGAAAEEGAGDEPKGAKWLPGWLEAGRLNDAGDAGVALAAAGPV